MALKHTHISIGLFLSRVSRYSEMLLFAIRSHYTCVPSSHTQVQQGSARGKGIAYIFGIFSDVRQRQCAL